MASSNDGRHRRYRGGDRGGRRPNESIEPQRVNVSFDGYRTLTLNTGVLHDRLYAAFGNRDSNPNLLFEIAGRVKGCLGAHRTERSGRRWVCLIYRTADLCAIMIAIPVIRDVLPVVCVQGASDDDALTVLNQFTAVL